MRFWGTEYNLLAALGRTAIYPVQELGRMSIFFFKSLYSIFLRPLRLRRIMEQIHFIGAKSQLVVALTGAFTGMVLGLQGYYTLSRFGSTGALGSMVGLALVRELGPVLTAIVVIARGGSAMAAELASMRISEQIDALRTMEVRPIKFLVSPRLVAAVVSFPLLTAIFDVVGILGGYLTGSLLLGLESGIYFSSVEYSVTMADVNGGFIKAIVFGVLVVIICCFGGYYAHRSPAGFGSRAVAFATTSSVILSIVVVLGSDYIVTSFLL